MTDGPVHLCLEHTKLHTITICHATTVLCLLTHLRAMPNGPVRAIPASGKMTYPSGRNRDFLMTARKDNANIDVVTAGRAIYEKLRERLEAEEWGRVVVIDVKSGDYEIAENHLAAALLLRERQPDAYT